MPGSNLHEQQLGSMIRRARESAGMSSRQLALQSGIRPSTISRIETGFSENPDAKNLQAIARVLAIDVEELYAAVGYLEGAELPELKPYLRAKFGITDDTANRIEGYVQALRHTPTHKPQQPPKEENNDHPRGDTNP